MRHRFPTGPGRALAVPGLATLLVGTLHAQSADSALAARSLAGMPADRMLALLAADRQGTAPATVMHQIVKGPSDDEPRPMARHFAAQ